ncbi:MAG: polyprenyl synthetase family protein [Anaerolineae bacterium]
MTRLPFLELISDELERVEALLRERPPGQHPAVGGAVEHLADGGGKRLRPALVLLSSYLCGAARERAVYAAVGVEMLHTATLVHDDLIDGALMRRGVETLNAQWTPAATVLTGDYVFARAAYLVAQTDSVRLMQRFAETLMTICNGEIRQLFDGQSASLSREAYERRIYAKTASLIVLSAEAGAILGQADEEKVTALRAYGDRVGMAFQIMDDVLDFVADRDVLGKPVGSDLRQGLVTLPVLLFLEREPDHPVVLQALEETPSREVAEEAARVVAASSALEQAVDVARRYAEEARQALQVFPDSPYRAALLELAEFTVHRRF